MLTYISLIVSHLKLLSRDEEGASAVEYGLILGLIAVAIVTVLLLMRGDLVDLFDGAQKGLAEANKPAT